MSKADGLKITLALDLCKLSWFSFIFLEVQLCACAGCAKSPQLCPTLCDPMGWALQAPLPMGFSRREYCVILVFLRKIQTSLVSFGGAPVTLIRAAGSSPFLSPGCAVIPWIWAYAAAKLEGISLLPLLLLSDHRFFTLALYHHLGNCPRPQVIFSLCSAILPCSLVSPRKRGSQSEPLAC